MDMLGVKELGRTGTFLPEVGLGTWGYHGGPTPLRKGIEMGAAFVDTAESYGTEMVVAEAVRGIRNQVIIATKVSAQNLRSSDLKRSADASLRNLGLDHIDLYQVHEPNRSIPIEETMGAMEDLVGAGKIRFIGVSNFSVDQLKKAQRALAKHRIVSNQLRYSLIDRTIEHGLLQYCQEHHVTVIAYSPLARDFTRIRDCDPDRIVDSLAQATGRTPAQIAINWCLRQNPVVAIPKGNSVEHIVENCGASGWQLSPEQVHELNRKIFFRRRNRLDMLVRRWMPDFARTFAAQAVGCLPPGLRRLVH
jgi:diketogulonate reductase-like aldo/keto reductase